MGQGGYGLDQAYLWYKRAGLPLDHQLHLVAFITDDFLRMQFDDFVGYGKPLLGVRGDSIAVLNAPVPNRSRLGRWWVAKGNRVMNLNIVQLANRVFGDPPTDRYNAARNDSTRTVVARIFQDLARINAAKNSRLVLVLLPGASDYRSRRAAAVVAQLRHRGGGATRYPVHRPLRAAQAPAAHADRQSLSAGRPLLGARQRVRRAGDPRCAGGPTRRELRRGRRALTSARAPRLTCQQRRAEHTGAVAEPRPSSSVRHSGLNR